MKLRHRRLLLYTALILTSISWVLGFIVYRIMTKNLITCTTTNCILHASDSDRLTPKSILYTAMITGGSYFKRAKSSYHFWMQYLQPQNNFIITSNDTLSHSLSRANVVRVLDPKGSQDDYSSAQFRFLSSLETMFAIAEQRKDDTVRWFLISDDDTFVVPYNLFRVIENLEKLNQEFVIAGCGTQDGKTIYAGGGVLVSKKAAAYLIEKLPQCSDFSYTDYYDVTLAKCVPQILDQLGYNIQPFVRVKEMLSVPPPFDDKYYETFKDYASFHYIKDDTRKFAIRNNMFPNSYFELNNMK